ncbi:MAG TPA: DUF695 domain-containing protein [Crenotrichaceae bacterium]|nr:DUF695 domain-containing protein [Crenotrichaceae bacterium]
MNKEQAKGIIGKVVEDGKPVIYKFVNEIPSSEIQDKLPLLTVISWKYEGSQRNGMPEQSDNQRMIKLEDAIEDGVESNGACRHAYSRTGNNLKELVYYIHNRDEFLETLNQTLSNHTRYPIDISFYEDKKWEDFQKLLNDFSGAKNR